MKLVETLLEWWYLEKKREDGTRKQRLVQAFKDFFGIEPEIRKIDPLKITSPLQASRIFHKEELSSGIVGLCQKIVHYTLDRGKFYALELIVKENDNNVGGREKEWREECKEGVFRDTIVIERSLVREGLEYIIRIHVIR